MQKSRIIQAGIAAAGALIGWAVTADRAEISRQRWEESVEKEFNEFVDERDAEWSRLLADKTEQIFALKHRLSKMETNVVLELDADQLKENVEKVLSETKKLDEAIEKKTSKSIRRESKTAEDLEIQALQKTAENSAGPEIVEFASKIEPIENNFEEPVIDETKGETVPEEEVDEGEYQKARRRLQSLIDPYLKDPVDAETFVSHGTTSVLDKTPPFVITQNEYAFGDEGNDYDKIVVTYYPVDRVMLDEDDEVMTDIDNTIGWKNLQQFGGTSGDPNVVFIRNRRLEIDFEVIREEEQALPAHVRYGMDQETFNAAKAGGLLKFRPEDQ